MMMDEAASSHVFRTARFFTYAAAAHPSLRTFTHLWRLDEDSLYVCDVPFNPVAAMTAARKKLAVHHVVPAPAAAASGGGAAGGGTAAGDADLAGRFAAGLAKAFKGRVVAGDFADAEGRFTGCRYSTAFYAADLAWLRSEAYAEAAAAVAGVAWMAGARGGGMGAAEGVLLTVLAAATLAPAEVQHFDAFGLASAGTAVGGGGSTFPSDMSFCPEEVGLGRLPLAGLNRKRC